MQDVLTFDKMVNAFPVSLVKFDVAYPYGDKHDEFAKISEEAAELPNVFIGEVGIKDYGDKVLCVSVTLLSCLELEKCHVGLVKPFIRT